MGTNPLTSLFRPVRHYDVQNMHVHKLGVSKIRKFKSNSNVFLYSNLIRMRPTVFDFLNIWLA